MSSEPGPRDEVLPASLRDAQLRARRIPLPVRLLIVAPALAVAIVFISTFTGPYRWFATLEARITGGRYSPELAGALSVLICILPAVSIIHAIAKRLAPTPEEQARPPRANARFR